MLKLAHVFFLIFSSSPMPLFPHTNSSSNNNSNHSNSSMDISSNSSDSNISNSNTSPMVLFNSSSLHIKAESLPMLKASTFSPKPNPPKPLLLIQPLPVLAGMGPALPLMDIEANPELAIILLIIFLLLALLLLLLLLMRYVLPKNLVSCVSQCNLCYYSRRAAYQEIWHLVLEMINKHMRISHWQRSPDMIFVKNLTTAHFQIVDLTFWAFSFIWLELYPNFHISAHFTHVQWVNIVWYYQKLQLGLKRIHKVNFYPSDNYFTQALLVMLVTNIISATDLFQGKMFQTSQSFNQKVMKIPMLWSYIYK